MVSPNDNITLTLPRPILAGLSGVSASFADRMHGLLDKNSDGTISAQEKSELEALVRIAQLDQIVTLALQHSSVP
jgi:hypothetical protein